MTHPEESEQSALNPKLISDEEAGDEYVDAEGHMDQDIEGEYLDAEEFLLEVDDNELVAPSELAALY